MSQHPTTNISTLGFFKYFQNIVGWHLYGYIFINFLVGLLDGLGLAMFVPLLALATGSENANDSLGNLKFIVRLINQLGLELNLTTALLFMVSLFILKGIIYYIRSIYFMRIRLFAIRKIRLQLVSSLRHLSFERFTQLDSAVVQNNMLGETGRLINAMVQFFSTFQNVIMLLTYVILAFLSNWQFAILVGIGGLLSNFIYSYLNKVTKEYSKKLTTVGTDFNGLLMQALNYFKYLKATNTFRFWEKRLQTNVSESEAYTFKIGRIGAITESTREPVIVIIIAAVILIQVNVLGGNFPSIMVSLLLFYRALAHLATMQNAYNGFVGSSAGLESVEALLQDFNQHEEAVHSPNKIPHIQDIELQNVGVTYGKLDILKNINLSIQPKTSIAFVGESGAGKTTLANVICSLIPAHTGKIKVGGHDMKAMDLSDFRDKIGYITQEPVIFNGTIYDNITFWAEKTPENMEKFNTVIEMVSLKDFINRLELREDARTGNGGILMSGGQKQRISIARELYKDVELLVMDEATSALDSETEKYIKDNIDMLHGKFTMIIIAHRLSTVKNVDTVYLMDQGEIIASGRFNELTRHSEKFRQMVELQEI